MFGPDSATMSAVNAATAATDLARTAPAGAAGRRARRAEPQWLDPVEMAAWRGFIELQGPLLMALEAGLAPHGLTIGDYEVLVRLSETEGHQMRMCDLAAQLRLSPSGLTRRLDGLVKGELVRREPSSNDRRVMLATITDHGMRVLEDAAPDHADDVRRLFLAPLSRSELHALGTAFVKIRGCVDAEGAVS